MPAWPASLPGFSTGVSDTRQTGVIRSKTDFGPGKQRRRFSAVSRRLGAEMLLSDAERTTLETFYSTTLGEGALDFTMDDPHDGATVNCRFATPPMFTIMGAGNTRARLEIEVLP